MLKSLNGEWQLRQAGSEDWLAAKVPGCNYLDLTENSVIPDPFLYTNEKDTLWVGEKDWEYRKIFTLTEDELECDEVCLSCKMLDTVCDVYINDRLVGRGENCFVAYSFSVKDYLSVGENEIKIYFHSPVNFVREKYKKCPTPVNSNGQNGIVHIRKPQSHFGWDWGPVLPSSGITKDIELQFVKCAKIDFLKVSQAVCGDVGKITASAEISEFSDDYECEITLTSPDGAEEKVISSSAEFEVENPELWWTYELSGSKNQPLYTVRARLVRNGETLDEAEKKIGFRTLELNRERDEYGMNFQFRLNGVPLFIKGANCIPFDSFVTRFGGDKLNYFLDAAQFSNLNMLRVWGGGYYESDEFYAECDRRGILVWQDFQFACQAYPFFDDEFLANVKSEVKYNVTRLCHHPSLAVWNGNNEIEDMHMAWAHMTKYVQYTEKFFYHILEDEIRKYDKNTPYTPGSPIGISHNKGVSADNVGDTHLWGVWHGLKPMTYYRRRMTRFCSEFGFESLPDLNAIARYAKPSDYSFKSDVFKAHQKCMSGNEKMIYYIASRFNLPKNFRDYVYLSQVTQQECIADATEHWRRNKGRCNGSMYWQFNDCWGVCSWSSIDYYGNYKALQYKARHFNAPLTVSVEDGERDIKIFALNDFNEPKEICAEYEIFDFTHGTLESERAELTVPAVQNRLVFTLDLSEIKEKYSTKTTGVAVRLYENSALTAQKVVLLDKEKNVNLPKAHLKTVITKSARRLTLDIKTDNFARLVKAECTPVSLPFSDNFFDLLPNQSAQISIPVDPALGADEQARAVRVYSLCDIEPDLNPVKSAWARTRLFLSPVNVSNAIYHGKLSKDVKF